jgi:hypothetical protein
MLTKSTLLKYYKRRDIQDALVNHAHYKEIGVRYGDGFGKRPDILPYPRDVLELALRGCTSFHCSEENWENPLSISSKLKRKELDELRKGWDLVLDIDCAILEYSKICGHLIVEFLKFCGVKDISVKFSGNKGFHIALPFEAFPSMVGDTMTKDLFPEAPRKIAFFIKENIKEELGKRVIAFEKGDFGKVLERVGLPQSEIIRYEKNEMGGEVAKLNVDPFLEIDTVLLSSRHLFRMPYSLHEKSGLSSIPIDPESILLFEKPMAEPEKVVPTMEYMKRDVEESARRLLMRALDFKVKLEEERVEKTYEEIDIKSPITQEFFPPCVQKVLGGLEDGKKRAVFVLMNFLGKIGWSKEEIELYLKEWNKNNPEPLREVYFNGQLHSFEAGAKLPPNCDNEAYCKGIGVCEPDNFCKYIKNPVNYTILKWRRVIRQQEEENMKKENKKNQEDLPDKSSEKGILPTDS